MWHQLGFFFFFNYCMYCTVLLYKDCLKIYFWIWYSSLKLLIKLHIFKIYLNFYNLKKSFICSVFLIFYVFENFFSENIDLSTEVVYCTFKGLLWLVQYVCYLKVLFRVIKNSYSYLLWSFITKEQILWIHYYIYRNKSCFKPLNKSFMK